MHIQYLNEYMAGHTYKISIWNPDVSNYTEHVVCGTGPSSLLMGRFSLFSFFSDIPLSHFVHQVSSEDITMGLKDKVFLFFDILFNLDKDNDSKLHHCMWLNVYALVYHNNASFWLHINIHIYRWLLLWHFGPSFTCHTCVGLCDLAYSNDHVNMLFNTSVKRN